MFCAFDKALCRVRFTMSTGLLLSWRPPRGRESWLLA